MRLPCLCLARRVIGPCRGAFLAGLLAAASHASAAPSESGFEPLFDGTSLSGWLGQDMSFWSVEDGAITGTISPEHAPRMNQYLIWQREFLQDFELKLQFRFTGCSGKNENGGFQFRSRRLPNGDVAGYQVDNNFGLPWKVRLYDEHGRHDLALEGEQTVFDSSGRKVTEKLVLEPGASDFRLDEWHEYHLVAAGRRLLLKINGKRVAEVLDDDPQSFEPAGVLGLQLHTGPPMKVQFREIRLRRLPAMTALSGRETLLAGASLHWQLGDRIDSHQPPLKPLGEIRTGINAAGPPSHSGAKISQFTAACLDSDMALNDCRTWNVAGSNLTLYIRTRIPDGRWGGALFAKGSREGNPNFGLFGTGGVGEDAHVVFQVRTDHGLFSVRLPLTGAEVTKWQGLIGRYDGQTLQLSSNGKLRAEVAASGLLQPNSEPVLVGGESENGQKKGLFTGEMDDAALWNRALTAQEMAALLRPPATPSGTDEHPSGAARAVPGTIIDHSLAETGIYIGSPSLAVLPDGSYVASHDEFGPQSTEFTRAVTHVFGSKNRGGSWQRLSTIQGAFWSTLFAHRGNLYLLGTDKHHGNAVLRRSTDGGLTWTSPTSKATGLLRDDGQYHCGPVPVLEHAGRLWRGMEWRQPPEAWGINYRAGMLSVPTDADLLDASQWTCSTFLPSDRTWNGGDMGAWLEGNAVLAPDGPVLDVLRVQTTSPAEKAALVKISSDGQRASFDPASGFVAFPGGAKKFTIRFDPQTKLYWSLTSIVHELYRADNPGRIRNTLALTVSPDLVNWGVRCHLLYHPDVAKHGFQYVDWLFEGEDIIAACRTAYDDEGGGAHNNHDANFLTFHRFVGFRKLTLADSVPAR